MKEITSIKEIHLILLDIAKEFHCICTKHNIPYYMLGGTMLGAIRHKGFIPWDDDMDFGVPRVYFNKLKSVLENELPSKYKIFTIDNSDALFVNIVKIADVRTEIIEIGKEHISGQIGINIDIFPLDSINAKTCKTKVINILLRLQYLILQSTESRPLIKKYIALVTKQLFFFLSKRKIIDYIENHLIGEAGNLVANIYGAWATKEIVPQSVMGTPVLYKYEDFRLYGVADPSIYLSGLYGDYLKLPPESKRHYHIIKCYWID